MNKKLHSITSQVERNRLLPTDVLDAFQQLLACFGKQTNVHTDTGDSAIAITLVLTTGVLANR